MPDIEGAPRLYWVNPLTNSSEKGRLVIAATTVTLTALVTTLALVALATGPHSLSALQVPALSTHTFACIAAGSGLAIPLFIAASGLHLLEPSSLAEKDTPHEKARFLNSPKNVASLKAETIVEYVNTQKTPPRLVLCEEAVAKILTHNLALLTTPTWVNKLSLNTLLLPSYPVLDNKLYNEGLVVLASPESLQTLATTQEKKWNALFPSLSPDQLSTLLQTNIVNSITPLWPLLTPEKQKNTLMTLPAPFFWQLDHPVRGLSGYNEAAEERPLSKKDADLEACLKSTPINIDFSSTSEEQRSRLKTVSLTLSNPALLTLSDASLLTLLNTDQQASSYQKFSKQIQKILSTNNLPEKITNNGLCSIINSGISLSDPLLQQIKNSPPALALIQAPIRQNWLKSGTITLQQLSAAAKTSSNPAQFLVDSGVTAECWFTLFKDPSTKQDATHFLEVIKEFKPNIGSFTPQLPEEASFLACIQSSPEALVLIAPSTRIAWLQQHKITLTQLSTAAPYNLEPVGEKFHMVSENLLEASWFSRTSTEKQNTGIEDFLAKSGVHAELWFTLFKNPSTKQDAIDFLTTFYQQDNMNRLLGFFRPLDDLLHTSSDLDLNRALQEAKIHEMPWAVKTAEKLKEIKVL